MARKTVTQSDIAKKCNVSRVTVSHVLNSREGTWISEEVRQKVIQTALEMNYEFNSRKNTKTHFIGMVIPHTSSEVNLRLLNGVIVGADRKNYTVGIATTAHDPEHEREVVMNLISRGVEGIVLSPALRRRSDLEHDRFKLNDLNIPIVCVDACYDFFDTVHVYFNYEKAARELTNIFLAQGHKRIGFLHHFRDIYHPACEMRLAGYKAALQENGIEIDPELIDRPKGDINGAVELDVRTLINKGATAIIAQTDYVAIQVINELREMGLSVPDDIRVAGFDNLVAGRINQPALTTCEEPWERMGEVASNILLEMIESGKKLTDHIALPAEIIVRES